MKGILSPMKHSSEDTIGVILCGGEGKRLRPLTYYFQKAMIPVGSQQKPLLEYIVRLMKFHGITKITHRLQGTANRELL